MTHRIYQDLYLKKAADNIIINIKCKHLNIILKENYLSSYTFSTNNIILPFSDSISLSLRFPFLFLSDVLGLILNCIFEDVSPLVLHLELLKDVPFKSRLDFLGDGVDLLLIFLGFGGTAGLLGLFRELDDLEPPN